MVENEYYRCLDRKHYIVDIGHDSIAYHSLF